MSNGCWRWATRGAVALALAFVMSGLGAAVFAEGPERIHWKQLPDAQLKLDGKAPLTWNVYQGSKKKESHLILVLLGHRYLALDTKAKRVCEVQLSDLHAVGKDFESDNLMHASRVIPTTGWVSRDIGPAQSIKLKLGDYGRVLEVQLAHMPDLRGLY